MVVTIDFLRGPDGRQVGLDNVDYTANRRYRINSLAARSARRSFYKYNGVNAHFK